MNRPRTTPTRNRRPSPALVLSIAALVAALGGTAAALPGKNSVDRNDLRKGAVASKSIRADAVTAKHIADGQIGGAEIADGQIGSQDVADGQIGAADLTDPPASTPITTLANGGEGDCLWRNITDLDPEDGGLAPLNRASYYIDAFGIVHLAGYLKAVAGPDGDEECNPGSDPSDRVILTLPAGARPANAEIQGGGIVLIAPDETVRGGAFTAVSPGEVVTVASGTEISLDGITFRTEAGS
jgi:hypothetical protein